MPCSTVRSVFLLSNVNVIIQLSNASQTIPMNFFRNISATHLSKTDSKEEDLQYICDSTTNKKHNPHIHLKNFSPENFKLILITLEFHVDNGVQGLER